MKNHRPVLTDASRGSPKTGKEKVRLSLDISPELNALLEQLAIRTGGTKSDVLRKAISLMEVAVEAKRQGKKFGVAERDQQLATEIIGL
jgi:predicted transcriptional regulator